MNQTSIEFVRESIYGWIGNLMRDMDAQGVDLDIKDIISALEQVVHMIDQKPESEDYDALLRDTEDGRGNE